MTDKNKTVLKIQRWWKKCKKPSSQSVNQDDPMTLESIRPPYFIHVCPGGKEYTFNAFNLANYFIKSGQYKNPYNRIPFNNIELGRLDRILTKNKYKSIKFKGNTLHTELVQDAKEQESTYDYIASQLKYFLLNDLCFYFSNVDTEEIILLVMKNNYFLQTFFTKMQRLKLLENRIRIFKETHNIDEGKVQTTTLDVLQDMLDTLIETYPNNSSIHIFIRCFLCLMNSMYPFQSTREVRLNNYNFKMIFCLNFIYSGRF